MRIESLINREIRPKTAPDEGSRPARTRAARGVSATPEKKKRNWPKKLNVGSCNISGCDNPSYRKRMCNMHYLRQYRHGSVGPVEPLRENHSLKKTKEYTAWQNMKARCSNSNLPSYPRYGGRGISVCDRWKKSFGDFLTDLGPAESKTHSLDRIDNDGNYEPSNCRWVLPLTNGRNRESTKLTRDLADEIRAAYAAGKYQMKKELAAHYGISTSLLNNVLKNQRWAE